MDFLIQALGYLSFNLAGEALKAAVWAFVFSRIVFRFPK